MKLKSLEIQGFKSFADRTVLEFNDGVTAVVGPNGSGKSNISDAMRWVMGEQSAKSLRGGNMQDVIFAGTQKRKPLGFAEVSLVIDNSDKTLSVDFDEVVVTRRLFRSGESEYYINKSSVRLKDIHELFMDTGVGREGYSIIGQGKIAEIVNTKSEDRRAMFEEAAGITKFRYRKEEAERKLSHTNDNVLRVNDIISEIEGQIGPLKIQSEKAKKYLNLRDKLKTLEVNVALENIASYRENIDVVGKKVSELNFRLEKIRISVEENEEKTAKIYAEISEYENLVTKLRNQFDENREQLASHETDISVLKSKIDGNNSNIKRIETEIGELNLKFDDAEKSVESELSELEKYSNLREELRSEYKKHEDRLEEFNKAERIQNEEIDLINTEIIELMNKAADLRAKISNYRALSQSYDERKDSILKDLETKKADLEKLSENARIIRKKYSEAVEENALLTERAKQEKSKNLKLISERDAAEKEYRAQKSKLENFVLRQKLLKDLEKSFDNYSKSVKAVMNANGKGELGGAKLYGTVAGIINVERKYATALETALGGAAQYIVTASEEDAKLAIEYLKRTKQGRATFLPITAAKNSVFDVSSFKNMPGYIGVASSLVDYDEKYEKIISGLLGRVAVVDNIDNAVKIAKANSYRFRIVTLTGELLAPGGSMSGGSKHNSSGIFARANELSELNSLIPETEKSLSAAESEYLSLSEQTQKSRDSFEKLNAQLVEKTAETVRLKADIEHSEAFEKSAKSACDAIEAELKLLSDQTAEMSGSISVYERKVEDVNLKISELEKNAGDKRKNITDKYTLREKIESEIETVKEKINDVEKNIGLFNQKIELVNRNKHEINLSIGQKNDNISEMREANDDILSDIEFKREQIDSLNEELAEIKTEIEKSETKRKEALEKVKDGREENKKLLEEQMLVSQEQSRADSKKNRAEVELENVINRLWDDYELTVSDAEELKTEIPPDAQKQVNSLKNEIKDLGNINIDAIEEYKNVGERYEFLTSQRNDLVEAKKNLEQVIEDMLLIMKKQFTEKFTVINKYFGETFSELFGGGAAELSLTDPKDVLNSGVEINVQPPGKAVKSMLQLSGGEQAFVSIALLFAILKVRPSPFCVLDEIEAALDDVNVFRFADYLKKFSKNSQFIVVTHRRGTMESANILYGITMQEQGVSGLLSLNIDDVMKMNLG